MPFNGPIVIAAAGMGSRLGQGRPKAMVEVGGRSIIERLLTDCLHDEKDIRIVVGYQEQDLIDHVKAVRPDVVFVRNPDYRDGATRRSYWLGTQIIKQPLIMLDGDLIIAPASWRAFAEHAGKAATEAASQAERFIIGVAPSTTTDAVFVKTEGGTASAPARVTGFTREERQPYEWASIALVDAGCFTANKNYVYDCLSAYLPLPAFVVNIAEVDTPADLKVAEEWLKKNGQ